MLVSAAKPMRIKEDILACSAAELNYGLAQFVKEITRPNGERYEPDSIYYLCLGIQQVRETTCCPQVVYSQTWWSDLVRGACTLHSAFWEPREAVCSLLQCLSPGQPPTWFGLSSQAQRVGWQLFPSLAPFLHISEEGWGISPNSHSSSAPSLLCHAPGFSLQLSEVSAQQLWWCKEGCSACVPWALWGGFAFQVLLCFS